MSARERQVSEGAGRPSTIPHRQAWGSEGAMHKRLRLPYTSTFSLGVGHSVTTTFPSVVRFSHPPLHQLTFTSAPYHSDIQFTSITPSLCLVYLTRVLDHSHFHLDLLLPRHFLLYAGSSTLSPSAISYRCPTSLTTFFSLAPTSRPP